MVANPSDNPYLPEIHLPFSGSDLKLLRGYAELYQTRGINNILDAKTATKGYITITAKNWLPDFDAPFISFEIHKMRGKKVLFCRQTHYWLARVITSQNRNGAFAVDHGYIPRMLVYAGILNEVLSHRWDGFGGTPPKELGEMCSATRRK